MNLAVGLLVLSVLILLGVFFIREMDQAEGEKEIIVRLKEGSSEKEVADIARAYSARVRKSFQAAHSHEGGNLHRYYSFYVAPSLYDGLMDALIHSPHVEFAREPVPMSAFKRGKIPGDKDFVNDPQVATQWWVHNDTIIDLHEILDSIQPVRPAKVAIVDTGVDSKHPDIAPVWEESAGGTDTGIHGTHVAGIAGGATNNEEGIASLNLDQRFIDITGHVAIPGGSGSDETVARAIEEAIDQGVDVINLSLGGPDSGFMGPGPQEHAIMKALDKNIIVVAAAGNDGGRDAMGYSPVNIEGVIGVSSLDHTGRISSFSNVVNNHPRGIAAPGGDILSTVPGGRYDELSGTSMAAPFVAGVIGIMRSIKPDLTADQAYEILRVTGGKGPSVDKAGITMHPLRAIQYLLGHTDLDEETYLRDGVLTRPPNAPDFGTAPPAWEEGEEMSSHSMTMTLIMALVVLALIAGAFYMLSKASTGAKKK
jgi:thermitase